MVLSMKMPLLRDPTARTFIPQSRVLLERRPVTFESDNEDDSTSLPIPQLPHPTVDSVLGTTPSEIAYIQEGCMQSERVDLSGEYLVAALQSLPRDAWMTLLDDSDRRRLATYLPSLEGWNEMANGDAQRMAVEALLSRENLHFGNPLTALEKGVRDGSCTAQATAAREAYKKQGMAQFALERHSRIQSRIENLKEKKKEAQRSDQSTPKWKKIRIANDFAFIHRTDAVEISSSRTILVSENTSIFLGIRSILRKPKLNIYEIVDKLRSDFSRPCASIENDLPLFLTFDKYIEAALAFLSGDHVPTDPDLSQWSDAVFVHLDSESKEYEWSTNHDESEVRSLLLLEQIFRAPVASDFLDYTTNSSGVKATRKRRDRIVTQRARDALLASNSSFAALDVYRSSRPSLQLKRTLIEQEASVSKELN